MISISKFAVGIGLVAVAALTAAPASAGCKRMQFLVNDYGKDGPTKTSQELLDKHIATWAAEQGIEKYTVGKKDTTCELFLNFILFDEHTCTTRATVCWGGDKLPGEQAKASKKPATEKSADAGKVEPAKAEGAPKAAETTAEAVAVPPAAASATPPSEEGKAAAESAAAGATPAEAKTSEPKAPVSASVETGTIPLSNKPADSAPATPAAADAADPSIPVTQRDAVAAATAAAERAAAAAERAAAAAERATAALNERIAAEAERDQAAGKAEASAAADKPAFTPPNAALVAPVQPTTKQ